MGYDVHITRAQHWAENAGNEIAPAEWVALIEDDPELVLALEYGPYFALWIGPSSYSNSWFSWERGNIYSKGPGEKVTEKMLALAQRLGAKVQGDDGETIVDVFPLKWVTSDGIVHQRTVRQWLARLFLR